MTRYIFAIIGIVLCAVVAIGFFAYRRSATTSLLHEAAHQGDLPEAKRLLAAGHDINQRNRGDALGVRIREYPLPYENDVTPLYVAVASTQPKIVDLLLSRGANPNLGGGYDTPLHRAFGNLSPPFNIHGYDLSDEPPFDLNASIEVIRLLLAHGADIHLQRNPGNPYCKTPLETCEEMDDDEVRATLLGWMSDPQLTQEMP